MSPLAGQGPGEVLAGLPDFDSYPIDHSVEEARPVQDAVWVRWDDGLECRYHVFWLRENAADPATTHPVTREQALQLLDIPEDLACVAAATDRAGNLVVHWSSGEESQFHPGWLRAHSHGAAPHFALPDRVIWGGELQDELPRFDGPAVLQDEGELGRWAEALHVYGIALLEGLPAAPEVIEEVPARLGPLRRTNFGRVFDVRSRPDADSNAYTSLALPLHSDLTTREYMPGLQFLHCLENEAPGGDSRFADGFHIARSLADAEPALFDVLSRVPLCFSNKAKDSDHRWQAPVFRLDDSGNCAEVRWSPWLRAPVVLPFDETRLVYRALRRAFAEAEDPKHRIEIRLKPGDLVGFDNRRVLHGRSGFDPAGGKRWLRGCYVEREELESRLRILARQKKFAALCRPCR